MVIFSYGRFLLISSVMLSVFFIAPLHVVAMLGSDPLNIDINRSEDSVPGDDDLIASKRLVKNTSVLQQKASVNVFSKTKEMDSQFFPDSSIEETIKSMREILYFSGTMNKKKMIEQPAFFDDLVTFNDALLAQYDNARLKRKYFLIGALEIASEIRGWVGGIILIGLL